MLLALKFVVYYYAMLFLVFAPTVFLRYRFDDKQYIIYNYYLLFYMAVAFHYIALLALIRTLGEFFLLSPVLPPFCVVSRSYLLSLIIPRHILLDLTSSLLLYFSYLPFYSLLYFSLSSFSANSVLICQSLNFPSHLFPLPSFFCNLLFCFAPSRFLPYSYFSSYLLRYFLLVYLFIFLPFF